MRLRLLSKSLNWAPGTLLDLELSALQNESKAEIISSPRLITTNKQPAYIEQGTEILIWNRLPVVPLRSRLKKRY